jgi:hypothetical protein
MLKHLIVGALFGSRSGGLLLAAAPGQPQRQQRRGQPLAQKLTPMVPPMNVSSM